MAAPVNVASCTSGSVPAPATSAVSRASAASRSLVCGTHATAPGIPGPHQEMWSREHPFGLRGPFAHRRERYALSWPLICLQRLSAGTRRDRSKPTYVLLITCQAGISVRPPISFCIRGRPSMLQQIGSSGMTGSPLAGCPSRVMTPWGEDCFPPLPTSKSKTPRSRPAPRRTDQRWQSDCPASRRGHLWRKRAASASRRRALCQRL